LFYSGRCIVLFVANKKNKTKSRFPWDFVKKILFVDFFKVQEIPLDSILFLMIIKQKKSFLLSDVTRYGWKWKNLKGLESAWFINLRHFGGIDNLQICTKPPAKANIFALVYGSSQIFILRGHLNLTKNQDLGLCGFNHFNPQPSLQFFTLGLQKNQQGNLS